MRYRWQLIRRILPQSLVGRVFVLYLTTWLLIMGTGLAIYYQTRFTQVIRDAQESAASLLEVSAHIVSDSAVIGDYDTIQRTLNKMVVSPSFLSAQFIPIDAGKMSSHPKSRAPTDSAPEWIVHQVSSRLYEDNRVLIVGGRDYGVLRLSFDDIQIAQEMWQVAQAAVYMMLIAFATGLILIWYPLRRWLGTLHEVHSRSFEVGGHNDADNLALIEQAPAELRQTLIRLQSTTSQLRTELEQRESTLSALQNVLASMRTEASNEFLDTSESTSSTSDIIQQISTLIQEREQTRLALIHAKEQAEAANRAKSDFLANMSHEIRTPMNGMIGMLELCLDTKLDSEQKEYLNVAQRSAENLQVIIRDILDFSKIEANKIEIEKLPVRLHDLLKDLIPSHQTMAARKNLALSLQINEFVPQQILSDPVRINQILNNLLSNALKFTEYGAVNIECQYEPNADLPLSIAVSDSGIGIPLQDQERVFDAFAQQDISTTRRFGGTGLGLSISQRLANLMGGKITVQSRPGLGSCFTLHLPATITDSSVTSEQSEPIQARSHLSAVLEILIAEDNEVNQTLITTLIKKQGHQWKVANNGQEAVALCEYQRFDLILMDLQMPVMGGLEATALIRQIEQKRHLTGMPIYALSASALASEQEAALAVGLDGYMTKPINRHALNKLLQEIAITKGQALSLQSIQVEATPPRPPSHI